MHHPIRSARYLLVPALALLTHSALAQDREGDGEARRERAPAIPQVDPNTPSGIFGGVGQLAISSDAGLSISHKSVSGGASTTELQLRPAVDYFVIDNLSVGGFLGLDYQRTEPSSSTTFSIGPRVGYNVPLSPLFSIWPKAGLSFGSTSTKVDATAVTPEVSSSNTAAAINLFVPVMLHPATHFFLGFGPALDAQLSGDNKATTIAGRLTIGGWI